MTSDTTPSAMRSDLFWKSTGAVDHRAISSTVSAMKLLGGCLFKLSKATGRVRFRSGADRKGRTLRDEACPLDRSIWSSLAELGVTGVLVPEDQGGSGLGLLDAVVAAQALGHAVTPSAFLSAGVMAPVVLSLLGGAEAERCLSGIASGELVVGTAFTELFSVCENAGVRLCAGMLSGKTMMTLDGCAADLILVPVGADQVVLVDCKAGGMSRTRLALTDQTRCTTEIVFEDVSPLAVFEGAGNAI